jgi:hypothetical protein
MTMDKVTYFKDAVGNDHALIDHGNEEFTSMLKSTYDAQQAELKPAKALKVVDEATPE